ncbi:hypothetical protein KIS4809_5680 [Bacillus sp. ZZV12-4809]|nr:hypothetical protein KIS4809_5680 [Bacillus sp. ZZV12-4809]
MASFFSFASLVCVAVLKLRVLYSKSAAESGSLYFDNHLFLIQQVLMFKEGDRSSNPFSYVKEKVILL